jgi:hypothetical protein
VLGQPLEGAEVYRPEKSDTTFSNGLTNDKGIVLLKTSAKATDTVRLGVKGTLTTTGMLCKKRTLHWYLKREKTYPIPHNTDLSLVTLRVKRRFSPFYDGLDIGTGVALAAGAVAWKLSYTEYDLYKSNFLNPVRNKHYTNANNWHHIALGAFTAAALAQGVRWTFGCWCKNRGRRK